MLQAIVKKGKVVATRVPTPRVSDGCLLIKVVNSCISAGTEMANVNVTKGSLIKKALEQPDKVKMVIDFARSNGIERTWLKVRGELDGGKPTGYSVAGIVMAVGKGVEGFEPGDHVAAAGSGIANHAEFVDVPQKLCMKMPAGMDFKGASTVTLGGIAMQGVRRADLRMGEYAVVVGAGILGLLAQQMLQLSGVRTIVTDLDPHRLEIAKALGAEKVMNPATDDVVKLVNNYTDGHGADAVIFTAATSSSAPLSQSFKMCKRKGKVVLVGVVGMEIERGDMYMKELDFLMSTSYGPGRYDPSYEEKGNDYPYAYVRWTENRNMTEYLRLVHEGKITLEGMIDAEYPIDQVEQAFAALDSSEGQKPIMVLLDYGKENGQEVLSKDYDQVVPLNTRPPVKGAVKVGLIGAGAFATGMHLPNMQKLGNKYQLQAVMNRTPFKAKKVGDQFGAAYATGEIDKILDDPEIDLVLVSTRHDSHAELVMRSLEKGKHVFVEKPLAIHAEELQRIADFYADGFEGKPVLMTGFNRRFSRYAQEIKKHTDKRINPLFVHYRMNAGFIPLDHWVHEDGGRIIGEGCHLIDLMNFLTGSKIASVSYEHLRPSTGKFNAEDNVMMILRYEDGSVCSIHYFAVGSKQMGKEYMEVHFDESVIVMDDYKSLKGSGIKVKEVSSSLPSKGQLEELDRLYDTLSGKTKEWPIALWDMLQTTEISFAVAERE